MKAVLAAVNAKYIHSNLAVYCLGAYARMRGEQAEFKEYTINQNPEEILKDLYLAKPDFLALSCYIWNISLMREIAAELHKLLPEMPIWVGGPEVSYDAEHFLRENPWASGVMRGEGEITFTELLGRIRENRDLYGLPGITWRGKDGEAIANEDRPVMDLSEVPFPYTELTDFEHRIIYYESSRGCPFSCSYCLSSIDKKLRFRDLSLVFRELQFFLDHRVPQVKFVDRTFNCRHDHAKAIWRYLLEHDNGVTNFHFEVAADLLDEEELELIAAMRPGLIQLEIGVQSTNGQTITEIHRKMDFAGVSAVVNRVKQGHNVHQHLDLIAGLPFEDLESFKQSFNDVFALQPDQLQLGFLKVLKGSFMYRMADTYGCVYRDKEPYEVLFTRWLPYCDVLRLKRVEEMVEVYYNSAQFTCTLPACMTVFEDAFSFFDSLGSFYEKKGYFSVAHTRIRRYEILQEFMAEYVGEEDMAKYREWMVFDLYLRENMKTRPSWAADLSGWKSAFRDFYQKEEESREYLPELAGRESRQLAKMTHLEVFSHIFEKETAVLFCYETRDPLSHSARWQKVEEIGKNCSEQSGSFDHEIVKT